MPGRWGPRGRLARWRETLSTLSDTAWLTGLCQVRQQQAGPLGPAQARPLALGPQQWESSGGHPSSHRAGTLPPLPCLPAKVSSSSYSHTLGARVPGPGRDLQANRRSSLSLAPPAPAPERSCARCEGGDLGATRMCHALGPRGTGQGMDCGVGSSGQHASGTPSMQAAGRGLP